VDCAQDGLEGVDDLRKWKILADIPRSAEP